MLLLSPVLSVVADVVTGAGVVVVLSSADRPEIAAARCLGEVIFSN